MLGPAQLGTSIDTREPVNTLYIKNEKNNLAPKNRSSLQWLLYKLVGTHVIFSLYMSFQSSQPQMTWVTSLILDEARSDQTNSQRRTQTRGPEHSRRIEN